MAQFFFCDVIQDIIQSPLKSVKFWILGSRDERQTGEQITDSTDPCRVKNLMGFTELTVVVELLRRSVMLLTNDSGPMHIAAALNIPTVSFFGPTDPEKTGPFGKDHKVFRTQVPCAPCFQRKCPLSQQLCLFDSIDHTKVSDHIINHLARKESSLGR